MKKLVILLLLTLFSFILIAQERELSNYEKYRIEKENESYITPTVQDTVHDTVYVEVETSEPVVVNNYYVSETQPNLRFNLAFGYGWGYCNQPYYRYYDPWYSYGYGWGYPYYGYGYYPYYGHNHYYGHNYYNYGYYSRPRGQRYATSSALGWSKNYYRSYNRQNVGSPRTAGITPKTRTTKSVTTRQTPIRQTTRVINSRTNGERNAYSPRYNKPTSRSRAAYNNSKVTRSRTTTQTKAVQSQRQQQRSNYVRPSSSTRQRSYTPSTAPSRSYRAPSSAPSRSYSSPSRSSGSRSYSTPSRSSSSRSSGSRSSSGSSSRSSGGRR